MSYHLVFFSKISRNFNSTFIQIVNNLESPLLLYIKLPSLAQYVYTKNTLNWCTNLNFNHFIYCQILIFSYLQSLPCTPPLLFWFFAHAYTNTLGAFGLVSHPWIWNIWCLFYSLKCHGNYLASSAFGHQG